MKEVRGQVWIETVIYTLIAFVMIGLVLSFAKPKIEEFQDKAVIEQSINILKDIDTIITEIERYGVGNQRELDIGITKGELTINGITNLLVFEIESKYQYSEPGTDLAEGGLTINTEKKGDLNIVKLTKNYDSNYDLFYQQETNGKKIISQAASEYKLVISNEGINMNGKTKINFGVN